MPIRAPGSDAIRRRSASLSDDVMSTCANDPVMGACAFGSEGKSWVEGGDPGMAVATPKEDGDANVGLC